MITGSDIITFLQEQTGLPGNILVTNQLYSLPDAAYMTRLGHKIK